MASNIAATLSKTIFHVLESPFVPLNQLDILSDRDREQIIAWNSRCPKPTTLFLHDMVSETAALQPDAPAIISWDGELTYAELDEMSSRLAHYLVSLGVGPEVFVITCFPKTLWMIVTMMAIMKAGGAFVPLDPSAPSKRQDAIIQALNATIAIVDESLAPQFDGRIERVITNLSSLLQQLPFIEKKACDSITSSTAAYVMFSSGSTGQPKGITIHHGAAAVSIPALGPSLGLTSNHRVLQFAAWTFDVCLGDIFPPLLCGASLCIPADEERISDLGGAINRLKVSYATITPTVAGLLTPAQVPGLETLVLGGEAATQDNISTWAEHVRLYNAYGPTECVVWNLGTRIKPSGSPMCIGRGMNAIFWIVDPQNNERLAPIGSIGELVIEGPAVGRGYLNDPSKTAMAFIEQPPWSKKLEINAPYDGRAYKTGDLARYNADGTAHFVGRKDAQVKLHGQRMDLAGIEHQIRSNLVQGAQVVVDIVKRKTIKILGAFIHLPDQVQATGPLDDSLVPMDEPLRQIIKSLIGSLNETLPSFMVPRVYFIPKRIPTTSSLKTDRKRLLLMANQLDDEVFRAYTLQEQGNQKAVPASDIGLKLRDFWAEILSTSPDSIGAGDSFFEVGGDSISAMRLVSSARDKGLSFSVTDVFRYHTLDELAAAVTIVESRTSAEIVPFSLLENEDEASKIKAKAELVCNTSINDIYPCTAIQEGFMAMTVKDAGAYVSQYVFDLPPSIDITRFKEAWNLVVQNSPILRTRIVQANSGVLYQVVTDEKISWQSTTNVEDYLREDSRVALGLGDSLSRYAIVQDRHGKSNQFVWTAHHAIYDGWCFDTLLDLVSLTYEKGAVPETPNFNSFIKYIRDLDVTKSDKYWKERLHGANQPTFPAPLTLATRAPANESINLAFQVSRKARSNITMATVLRAAWAMIVARYSDSDDIVFGVTSIGRNAPVEGIDMIIGPTITTIPIRVTLSRSQTLARFLADVQAQAIDSIPFEQIPMRKIKNLSADAALACDFQNLLVVQSDEAETGENSLGMKLVNTAEEMLHPYPLVVECSMSDGGISLRTQHDTNVISTAQVERILKQFRHVIQQLNALTDDQTVGDLKILSPEDYTQILEWNKVMPASANVCAHKLIHNKTLLQPDAPAVSAWDASFTYKELDHISTNLARHLVSLGVGPEILVALCFEKSAWAVVAMLAVMKSGGAFVPLDPSHPMSRREEIISQTGAKVILSSREQSASAWGSLNVVTVDSSWINKADDALTTELNVQVSPNNILYVIFTSGSSGKPKGFEIEHAAFVSAATEQGRATFMSSESRIFQFSSYSFDVSILEIVTGLICGGCVCIASSEATKDITKAMSDMQVTWTCLTPSVAKLIQPEKVPSLKTLVLGGEAVSKSDVITWSERVNLVLGYGPSECSVAATTTLPLKPTSDPDNFGTPGSSLCWIVDAEDPTTLAPLGAVGEIMIEGPILARGYRNDPEKTAAAFIDAPNWLKEAAALRVASENSDNTALRLYRTGDLGRMNSDGSINFVSRKDRQVKVRGQRVELSEVEHHLSSFSAFRHFMVEFPSSGPFKKKLVVVMSFHEIPISADGEGQLRIVSGSLKELAHTRAEEVCKTLAEIVPPYMVPTVRIVVEDMPYTPSGKINRVRVRTWLNTLDDETYNQLLDHEEEEKAEDPTTDLELSLRRIWSVALNLKINQISLKKSFFQVGGDSILAMQVMALAREEGLEVSVQDILRSRNILELAQFVEEAAKSRSQVLDEGLSISNDAVVDADYDFWGISQSHNLLLPGQDNDIQYRFSLDRKLTSSILKECHKTLRSEPIDVILAALIHSFRSIFPERYAPTIFNHNGGRELWRSEATSDDVVDILRRVKESRRSLSRNLSGGKIRAELVIDYADLQEHGDDLSKSSSLPTATQISLMSLVAQIRNGSLKISFSRSRAIRRSTERMLPWMRQFKLSLMDLTQSLIARTPSLTTADFPLVSLSEEKLNELVEVTMPSIGKEIQDIEDIYPCSALQQGILISQIQDTSAGLYEDWAVWEVMPQLPNTIVDPIKLEKAWQEVVARHGMMRAVLIQSIAAEGVFGQVVLSKYQAKTAIVQYNSYYEWRVSTKEPMEYVGLHPPHRLTICTTRDGRVYCELESNHAINDGESSSLLLRDFALAYDNLLPHGSGPRYGEFISYLQKQNVTSGAYWKSYLAGIIPSHFPALVDTTESKRELLFSEIKPTVSTKALTDFCVANGTTLSALFQLIWAMVLRTYTGSDDVCFGFINSGRDTPIAGILDAVGPFLSVLTSRVSFSKDDSAADVLEKLQADFANSLPHQHFGMAEVQRTLGMSGEPLFNSGMSFRKSATQKPNASIAFKPLDEVGRTEVSNIPFRLPYY